MAFDLPRTAIHPFIATLLVAFGATALPHRALAEGFRIETKIYAGDEKQPVSETTTLFLDGMVYDFLASSPAQIAVFRHPTGGKPGQFVLLDVGERMQTKFSTDQLAGAMDKLRTWASRQNDPFLKFAADPQFDESFEPDTGRLVLASHVESYTVRTSHAPHAESLAAYREFLDWYTRLNTLISAGPPPEPRLQLNAALARHAVVPLDVELQRAGEKEPLRAEHDFTWRLSRRDIERIDEVRASLASYRVVTNSEFQRATQANP